MPDDRDRPDVPEVILAPVATFAKSVLRAKLTLCVRAQ